MLTKPISDFSRVSSGQWLPLTVSNLHVHSLYLPGNIAGVRAWLLHVTTQVQFSIGGGVTLLRSVYTQRFLSQWPQSHSNKFGMNRCGVWLIVPFSPHSVVLQSYYKPPPFSFVVYHCPCKGHWGQFPWKYSWHCVCVYMNCDCRTVF